MERKRDSVPLSEFTLLGIHMLPLFSLQVNLNSRRQLQLLIVCVIFEKKIQTRLLLHNPGSEQMSNVLN